MTRRFADLTPDHPPTWHPLETFCRPDPGNRRFADLTPGAGGRALTSPGGGGRRDGWASAGCQTRTEWTAGTLRSRTPRG